MLVMFTTTLSMIPTLIKSNPLIWWENTLPIISTPTLPIQDRETTPIIYGHKVSNIIREQLKFLKLFISSLGNLTRTSQTLTNERKLLGNFQNLQRFTKGKLRNKIITIRGVRELDFTDWTLIHIRFMILQIINFKSNPIHGLVNSIQIQSMHLRIRPSLHPIHHFVIKNISNSRINLKN